MSLVVVVHMNKSFEQAKKSISKSITSDLNRKSIKDMTVKYWQYSVLKNKLSECSIVAGLKKGKICSAYKIDGFLNVDRLNGKGTLSERIEFLCSESFDKLVGLDLSEEENLYKGGWCIKTYEFDDLQNFINKQHYKIENNRQEILDEYKNLGIEYNPDTTYNYPQYYYGDKGSSYKRSDTVRRKTHERSNYICEYCHKNNVSLYCHHIDLLSEGGKDVLENTVSVCYSCHKSFHSSDDYETSFKPDLKKLRGKQ